MLHKFRGCFALLGFAVVSPLMPTTVPRLELAAIPLLGVAASINGASIDAAPIEAISLALNGFVIDSLGD